MRAGISGTQTCPGYGQPNNITDSSNITDGTAVEGCSNHELGFLYEHSIHLGRVLPVVGMHQVLGIRLNEQVAYPPLRPMLDSMSRFELLCSIGPGIRVRSWVGLAWHGVIVVGQIQHGFINHRKHTAQPEPRTESLEIWAVRSIDPRNCKAKMKEIPYQIRKRVLVGNPGVIDSDPMLNFIRSCEAAT